MGTIGLYFVQPSLERFLKKQKERNINVVFLILLLVFLIDLILTIVKL